MATITISGKIGLPNGTSHVGQIVWYPVRTPVKNGSTFVFTSPVYITTDSVGEFVQIIEPGYYDVDCVVSKVAQNPVRRFRVLVPNKATDTTIAFENLVATSGLTQVEEFSDFTGGSGGSVVTATTSTLGIVKIDQADADPVVMTKKSITSADGAGWIFRPVAGKSYVLNSTSGLYHELLCQTYQGVAGLGINQTGVAFSALPTA